MLFASFYKKRYDAMVELRPHRASATHRGRLQAFGVSTTRGAPGRCYGIGAYGELGDDGMWRGTVQRARAPIFSRFSQYDRTATVPSLFLDSGRMCTHRAPQNADQRHEKGKNCTYTCCGEEATRR